MLVLYQCARRGRLGTVDRRERLFGLLRLIVAERARDFRCKALAHGADHPRVSLDPRRTAVSQSVCTGVLMIPLLLVWKNASMCVICWQSCCSGSRSRLRTRICGESLSGVTGGNKYFRDH